MAPDLVDANGHRVLEFTGKVRNLGRIAELADAVIDVATSGAWRDYTTAVGRERWLEAELDYFLIACDMQYDDVSRVLAWNARAKELAPMMESGDDARRRPLETAASEWHSPTGESLMDRARRLGWLRANGAPRRPPIPARARTRAEHGMTREQQARLKRAERIAPERRQQLDELAERLVAEVAGRDERRYLIDRIVAEERDEEQATD